LSGILNLGRKQSGEMFSNEDLKILHTLANQVAVAIENTQLYKKMLRSDRLAAVGTLAARLAHEIRNPLVSIKTVTELLPERIDDPEFRTHFLGIAINEVERIKSLVDDLLNFAKPFAPNFLNENINRLLLDMLHLIHGEIRGKGIETVANLSNDVPAVMIDRDQMKQVFLNILLNAVQACNQHGIIKVATRLLNEDNGRLYVQIEITDNGHGIPEESLENLFDPFFTTKTDGMGLGLSIAHQIVQEHEGIVEVASKANEGTSFYINLPVSRENGKDNSI